MQEKHWLLQDLSYNPEIINRVTVQHAPNCCKKESWRIRSAGISFYMRRAHKETGKHGTETGICRGADGGKM